MKKQEINEDNLPDIDDMPRGAKIDEDVNQQIHGSAASGQQTKDDTMTDIPVTEAVQYDEEFEEVSRSEERRRDPKLASEGSQDPDGDGISFEELDESGEENARTTIKKLREKIKKLEAEKKDYLDLSQRTRADYMNFKKEVESARAADRKFATKNFISELLPVLDAYDMAQTNKEAWEKVDQNWRVGIEYIFGQLYAVLEKEGATQYGNIGDTFDPMLHESMEHVPVEDDKQDNTVVQVLQKGYKMGDTVLRPARVKTGEYKK